MQTSTLRPLLGSCVMRVRPFAAVSKRIQAAQPALLLAVRPAPGGALFQRLLASSVRAPRLTVVNVVANTGGKASTPGKVKQPLTPTAPKPTFEELGLSQPLIAALKTSGINEPTEIQRLAFPALTNGGNYILASHTGSGKTLAYLLPLVQALKAQEAEGFVPRPKRPRVLVLGPTKELTEQITRVSKVLCHHAKFRATCINTYKSFREQAAAMSGPMDVVVATPTKLLQHIKENNVFLRDVRWLVIDEADTVLSQGWGEEVAQILRPLQTKPEPSNVVMVSATLTKEVKRLIATTIPDMKPLETSTLHKAVAGSSHQFLTLPPGANKLQQLEELLVGDVRRGSKVLVFANSVDSCRAVEHHVREAGIPCCCYHGDMPPAGRQEAMARFSMLASASSSPSSSASRHGVDDDDDDFADLLGRENHSASTSSSSSVPVMIASDLAARGLDFAGAKVDHVINFDFPTTPVDYLHRTGRTARAGATGKVTSMVSPRDRVLAQRVEWALEHGESLDTLSADPHKLPPSQVETQRKARENAKVRQAVLVLGKGDKAAGMRLIRQKAKAAESDKPRGGKAKAQKGSSAGKAGSGAAAAKAVPALRGPVRGAARATLMQERMAQRNQEKKGSRGKGRDGKRGDRSR